MKFVLAYFLIALVSYLVGTFNLAFVLGKIRGFDIRKRGSGNAGASNALITMGNKAGVIVAFVDILKAFAVVTASQYFEGIAAFGAEVSATCCILGHIFPFYMKFRGGKGLACLGGVVFAFNLSLGCILLAVSIIMVLIVDYICVVPISMSVLFPLLHGVMTGRWIGALIILIATVAILSRHRENIRRIKQKTEAHVSFLWRRDEEIRKLKEEARSIHKDE